MAYHRDGSAEFHGLERITGRVMEHPGSFVVRHEGKFSEGEMRERSIILPDSGTGDLNGVKGEWSMTAGHQDEYPFTFTIHLP